MMKDEQGILDDDAWSYSQGHSRMDVLKAISWVLSGWSINDPKTDRDMARMVTNFIKTRAHHMTDKYPQSP